MLPPVYRQPYDQLKQLLERLKIQIPTIAASDLMTHTIEIQQFFQQHILSVSLDELSAADAYQVHSYQVEINKQLRLLNIDLTFLKAARSPATVAQRQQQLSDRLNILVSYCDALLE